jgi:hypothetical protein
MTTEAIQHHRKGGRPPSYGKVLPEKVVYEMAALGATETEMAKALGVSYEQFRVWCRQHPQLSAAKKKGKAVADERVVNALFEKALRGDTTAMIFWLKNRLPNDWRDRREFVGNIKTEDVTPIKFNKSSDDELRRIVGTRGFSLLARQAGETPNNGNGNGHAKKE